MYWISLINYYCFLYFVLLRIILLFLKFNKVGEGVVFTLKACAAEPCVKGAFRKTFLPGGSGDPKTFDRRVGAVSFRDIVVV